MTSPADILTSLTNKVASVLGSDWKELDYIYDLEKNTNTRGIGQKYGVGTRSGASVEGTNKAITIDFEYFVVLVNDFVNRSSDANQRIALSEIYQEFEEINKEVFQKKLNNSNVLLVSAISYEEPTVIDDQAISVTCNFTIKYRNQTF